MAIIQEIRNNQINELVALAVEKQTPLTVTLRVDRHWMNLHSRLLAIQNGRVVIEFPWTHEGGQPEMTERDVIGLSFKLKHHKHIFSSMVLAGGSMDVEGQPVRTLELEWPTRMQRLQRRAYERVDVPSNRIVRGSFWLGGREAEPAVVTTRSPVWTGKVANLSAGGVQLVCDAAVAESLEVGDAIGVHLSFGAADQVYYADAQFRHIEVIDGKVVMGFQFVGLDQTSEGRSTLRMISLKVAEFQNAAIAYHHRAV